MGFCVAAVLVWVLALGTVPVWGHRRLEPSAGAGSSQLSFRTVPGTRGLRAFTLAEIAAAVVVAIGAGLLVRSFIHLQGIDRGFDSNNLTVISILLPESRYPDPRARLALYDRLLPQVEAIPGVMSATPIHLGPGTGTVGLSAPMMFQGQTPDEAAKNPWASFDAVTPSYFRTLGVPIVRGRDFTDADSREAQPVAIVSEAVARRYWPGQDPLGKRVQVADEFGVGDGRGRGGGPQIPRADQAMADGLFPCRAVLLLLARIAGGPDRLTAGAARSGDPRGDPRSGTGGRGRLDCLDGCAAGERAVAAAHGPRRHGAVRADGDRPGGRGRLRRHVVRSAPARARAGRSIRARRKPRADLPGGCPAQRDARRRRRRGGARRGVGPHAVVALAPLRSRTCRSGDISGRRERAAGHRADRGVFPARRAATADPVAVLRGE